MLGLMEILIVNSSVLSEVTMNMNIVYSIYGSSGIHLAVDFHFFIPSA